MKFSIWDTNFQVFHRSFLFSAMSEHGTRPSDVSLSDIVGSINELPFELRLEILERVTPESLILLRDACPVSCFIHWIYGNSIVDPSTFFQFFEKFPVQIGSLYRFRRFVRNPKITKIRRNPQIVFSRSSSQYSRLPSFKNAAIPRTPTTSRSSIGMLESRLPMCGEIYHHLSPSFSKKFHR